MKFDEIVLFPFDALRVALFPKKCMCCGEIIDEDGDLCSICENGIEVIDPKKRCRFCGNEREYCTCKSRVYYFKNILCIYENDGIARKALYRYKLSRKSHYALFFAEKMAQSINTEFKGIKFSAVISVPTSSHSMLTRGFDHSKLLAQIVAEKIGVPYRKGIIKCRWFSRSQHKSEFSDRFSNTKNKYYFTKKIKYKNVLLVDDIKTTGASLDACARQLLLAGAENVYCVTATSAVNKNKKLQKK